ncbi:PASTA domain-containing protein, partial [Microbacterium testaceum]
EMLAGEQPYKGEQPMQIAYQHATDSVPRPSAKNPAVPEQLDELVLWSTEREPDDRPVDAGVMLQRLREVEKELGLAPQVARAVSVGTVGPATAAESRELTKVLPQTATIPDAPTEDADNATRLRAKTRRRTARGIWLLLLVLVLAGGSVTAGWYFGSGPGSLVEVPDVSQRSYADAEALLAQNQLLAQSQDVNDREIPAGTTVGSDPTAGSRLDKDTVVTVFVSAGPATHQIPELQGKSLDEVKGILGNAYVEVSNVTEEFANSAPGTVLSASITPRSGGDAIDCTAGCTIYEGDAASLTTSLGSMPDVSGLKTADAEGKLQSVGLKTTTSEEYSDSVASGVVIAIGDRDGGGNWRPGDTVTLRVSKGPQLFEVPNVVGMTRDEAKSTLSAAGFRVEYLPSWDLFPNNLTKVQSQDPSAESMVVKGTRVNLVLNVSA